jgi:tetratricopeptide (TPR) repeat protein
MQPWKPLAFCFAIFTNTHSLAAGKTSTELQSDINAITEKAQQDQQKLTQSLEKATSNVPAGTQAPTIGKSRDGVDVPVPPQGITTPDPERAPLVQKAPPKTIRAWIGEEIALEGIVKGPNKGPEKTYYAWIVDGVVTCQQQRCRIPLDNRSLSAGAHQILFVAYNIQGSSISRHILHVQKSSWTPNTALREKSIPTEAVEAEATKIQPLNPNKLHITMMQGNAVHAYPENVSVIGNVARNIPWEGQIKTAPKGVARITDPKTGKWFILGNGQANFAVDKQDSTKHNVTVNKGTVRAQSVEKADPQKKAERNNSVVSTKEVNAYLDPGVDFAITRVAPAADATKRRVSAKSVAEIAKSDQYQTRLTVISGTLRFQLPASAGVEAKTATIPPGVELVIFENGQVGSFERPNPEFMERLLRQTMTPEEIAERARRKAEAIKNPVNIEEVLKRVAEYVDRADYFEMLNELSTVEDRKDEDVRISYNLGLAYKGLYQPLEAEKHFRYAMNQNEETPDAAWQLGLMLLDEKKWPDAEDAFSEAYDRMPSGDKRSSEYHYYAGVSKFGIPKDFSAKNSFSRALLWEDNLEPALKASSGEFLKKLRERKDWSIVIPFGAQWDGNALALESSAAIPAGFTQRYLVRGIAGAVFSWDPAGSRDEPGWYNGYNLNVMYAKHFPEQFKSFNSLILALGTSQTRKTAIEIPPPADKPNEKPTPGISTLKFYENSQAIITNNVLTQISVTGGANYLTLDASLGYEHDMTTTKKQTVVLKETYGLKLWNGQNGMASDLDLASEQRLELNTSATAGHSLSATMTPSFSLPINTITNAKLSAALETKKLFYGANTLSITATPTVALTRFITPWLVGMLSGAYGIVYESDSSETSTASRSLYKPNAGFTLSGLF